MGLSVVGGWKKGTQVSWDDPRNNHISDAALARAARVGDREAFEAIVHRHPACQGELRPAVHSKPAPRRVRFGLIP